MTSWKTYRLGDICTLNYGKALTATNRVAGDVSVYSSAGITGWHNTPLVQSKGIIVGRKGTVGTVYYSDKPFYCIDTAYYILPDDEKYDFKWLYYRLKSLHLDKLNEDSAVPGLNRETAYAQEFPLPSLEEQRRIAGILGAIDDKIENNRRINANLELQAQALYKQWFVDNRNDDWEVGKVSDYYDITIGKTPPRKEKQWFSLNSQHTTWVSISDMGTCGMYISDSSEYLTADAVSRFNIKEVSPNTVLLSFKLTIGRVAISNGIMTTNEAIAHFNTERDYLLEYTYLALKAYEFSNLGSTSSIATAVNSKIIKAMRWIMPKESVLRDFHNLVSPIFRQIKNNILENEKLTTLRDTLLPKLMNGEIKTE